MKLYFSPGACSMSPHICLREAGLAFDTEQVDLATKKTAGGADFTKVSPLGYVPALQLDSGEILTEGPAIVQWIADQKPDSGLLPKNGTMARYHAQEWLNFITAELHKAIGALFNPAVPDSWRQATIDRLASRFDHITKQLDGKQFALGAQFSAVDAYLFTVLGWTSYLKISLDKWPAIQAYMTRVAARPQVQAAMKAEGLAK